MKTANKLLEWLGPDKTTLRRMTSPEGLRQRLLLAEQLAQSIPDKLSGPLLAWETTPGQPSYCKLIARIIIGRALDADITLPSSKVSRRHCEIYLQGETYVRDLNSLNGTRINGVPLGRKEQSLRSGDRIEIGPNIFIYIGS